MYCESKRHNPAPFFLEWDFEWGGAFSWKNAEVSGSGPRRAETENLREVTRGPNPPKSHDRKDRPRFTRENQPTEGENREEQEKGQTKERTGKRGQDKKKNEKGGEMGRKRKERERETEKTEKEKEKAGRQRLGGKRVQLKVAAGGQCKNMTT